jgi:hypothetical protein
MDSKTETTAQVDQKDTKAEKTVVEVKTDQAEAKVEAKTDVKTEKKEEVKADIKIEADKSTSASKNSEDKNSASIGGGMDDDDDNHLDEETRKELQTALEGFLEADHEADDEKQEAAENAAKEEELKNPDHLSKALDKMLELEALDVIDWTVVHESELIKVYKKKDDDSPVVLIKVYTSIPGVAPDKVFRLIYDLNIRKEWDNVLSDMRSFGKVSDDVDHMYSVYKAPIGISNRDFCQRRTKAKDYKGVPYMIHFESVTHPECPAVKKIVRAHTNISGYIIRPKKDKPNSTEMTILTQTDIKGQVPKAIVNLAAARAPSNWCKNFKKQADRLVKEGKI